MDKLNLLALMVALSAYLAAIRFAVIGRLATVPPPMNAASLKRFLLSLIPADAPLVIGGLLLTADLFWAPLVGGAAPGWLYWLAQWLFVAAIIVLAIHHAISWIITVSKATP